MIPAQALIYNADPARSPVAPPQNPNFSATAPPQQASVPTFQCGADGGGFAAPPPAGHAPAASPGTAAGMQETADSLMQRAVGASCGTLGFPFRPFFPKTGLAQ